MNYDGSKFKKEKVEQLIKENGISFQYVNELYYDSFVELFGNKKPLKIFVKKSSIIIERPFCSYCSVKTYKDFKEVLAFYVNEIVEEILNPLLQNNSTTNKRYKIKSLIR